MLSSISAVRSNGVTRARVRNRAFDLVSLGRTHLLVGEPDQAAATVEAALPHLDPHRPGRLARKMTEWYDEAEPFAAVSAVASVREQARGMQVTSGSK
jgi:hypothetical protein